MKRVKTNHEVKDLIESVETGERLIKQSRFLFGLISGLCWIGLVLSIVLMGATDKPCGEGVWMLTPKHVAKRYMFAEKLVPLHYES